MLAEYFKHVAFDALYTSPLIRARKTADAINLYHNLPISANEKLMEINAGVMEGVLWAELTEKHPVQGHYWNDEPWKFAAEGGDSMLDVYERIWRGITEIVAENPKKTVVAVSHGGAIRTLLCRVSGLVLERIKEVEWCDNTGVSIIDFEPDMTASLIVQNDNTHVPDELSTFARQAKGKGIRAGG